MAHSLQRWYAFAVFALRDFFATSPFDYGLYAWKARTVIILAETLFAMAAALALLTTAGWDALVRSKGGFLFTWFAIFVVIWRTHVMAEARLLHRFERDFRRLAKAQRVAITVAVLLLLALSVWAAVQAGAPVRTHLAGVR